MYTPRKHNSFQLNFKFMLWKSNPFQIPWFRLEWFRLCPVQGDYLIGQAKCNRRCSYAATRQTPSKKDLPLSLLMVSNSKMATRLHLIFTLWITYYLFDQYMYKCLERTCIYSCIYVISEQWQIWPLITCIYLLGENVYSFQLSFSIIKLLLSHLISR